MNTENVINSVNPLTGQNIEIILRQDNSYSVQDDQGMSMELTEQLSSFVNGEITLFREFG
ncbi:hypothetical protein L1267_18950 [Pseudoalteromonas sp. OFAV1]|jgi:hypothetical protein|uniref:hypothetical protein n=1 Tax=Pseudoalteromonas sp. OFAV1 TaxID=2908892 RepID=UPI001F377784|nr:hypothetical protein [Pseudoalteromonas sp. OFAV1]MCF2902452.1 hypothetical protein [Pseudoalteromonas sp. OFAV1]